MPSSPPIPLSSLLRGTEPASPLFRQGLKMWQVGQVKACQWFPKRQEIKASVASGSQGGEAILIQFTPEKPSSPLQVLCTCSIGQVVLCSHALAVLLFFARSKPEVLFNDLGPSFSPAKTRNLSPKTPTGQAVVGYFLVPPFSSVAGALTLCAGKAVETNVKLKAELFAFTQDAAELAARYATPTDLHLLRLLHQLSPVAPHQPHLRVFPFQQSDALWRQVVATDRLWMGLERSRHLTLGPPLAIAPVWIQGPEGEQTPVFRGPGDKPVLLLPFSRGWYLDVATSTTGEITTSFSQEALSLFRQAPTLAQGDPDSLLPLWLPRLQRYGLPSPRVKVRKTLPAIPPIPCLTCYGLTPGNKPRSEVPSCSTDLDAIRLEFEYHGVRLNSQLIDAVAEQSLGEEIYAIPRDAEAENSVLALLRSFGFKPLANYVYGILSDERRNDWSFGTNRAAWMKFSLEILPQLQAQGWRCAMENTFQYQVVQAPDWYAHASDPSPQGWFSYELGIELDGQRFNLLPLLLDLLRTNWLQLGPEKLVEETIYPVPLPDGRLLAFPGKRLKSIYSILVELLHAKSLPEDGRILLSKWRLAELASLEQNLSCQWSGSASLQQWRERLTQIHSIPLVAVPASFGATLRPYQIYGLSWLQFLRAHDLAGVLADDMGLGKTLQTLAHLLLEKEAGRLDRPSLIIAPTSLLSNWQREAQRFAPALKVKIWHGIDRHEQARDLKGQEIILTSYALVVRDVTLLSRLPFHFVILDEAQNIKNARTAAAQACGQLETRHRLALSGTPMENHLGELWSLFHFLLPGFLGSETQFREWFQKPIEKFGNAARHEVLVRRLRPFLLRRTKSEVAPELPPKTVITQSIELAGPQRDLYETLRLGLQQKVRAEIERIGAERSHIVFLDALLKLRQVCCDPRLVKLEAAQAIETSAKLEHLLELVGELLEGNRKILIFSQFTSMLALIEQAFRQRHWTYSLLTGSTTDRVTPIDRFQNGEVPLFLISLKAGGVGLNLTAADTVILYDPWWNPAVEEQAIGRAHRIGQSKPIFVYKLVTAGTVEEKIVAMQEHKRELARALLEQDGRGTITLDAADWEALLEPIGQSANE